MEISGWRDEKNAGMRGGWNQPAQPSDREAASEDTTGAKKNEETEKAKDRPRQSTACLDKKGA
jgi:hypothetical protein